MDTKNIQPKGARQPENVEAVKAALKEQSTGRWDYKEIDCCTTGKYADLDSGYNGIQLKAVEDGHAYCVARMGKTVVGDDCCFNLKDDNDEKEHQKAREAYLDQMYEMVCGCGYSGDWSGDDWFLSYDEEFKVPIVLDEENGVDAVKTAEAIIAASDAVFAPFTKEMEYLELAGSQLAGWKDGRGRRMKEGRVPKCAAWRAGE